jgi:hypothetical protein
MRGVRLRPSAAEVAALHTLASAAPELVRAPWRAVPLDEGAYVLTSPKLDDDAAALLEKRGLEVVTVADAAETREAAHLLEAIPPRPAAGDPLVDEALFVAPLDSPAPQRLLARLLDLGRDDVDVAALEVEGVKSLTVRVKEPPLYLLMRARDEPQEHTRAYYRAGPFAWLEWGWDHPLVDVADLALGEAGAVGVITREGRWWHLPVELPARSIYEFLTPRLDAPHHVASPLAGEHRFEVRLRLAPGPVVESEVFLLTQAQLVSLEQLVEAVPRAELTHVTLARAELSVSGRAEVRYFLRERLRPGARRIGMQVADITGARGFVHQPGADNLFLPAGRRLLPIMRRDELRSVFSLDRHDAVLIDEDGDGPFLIDVDDLVEEPMANWVELVATDRRAALDRVLEDALGSFPSVEVAPRPPPKRQVKPVQQRQPKELKVQRPKTPKVERVDAKTDDTDEGLPADVEALHQQVRALEEDLVVGGVTDGRKWADLARLKRALGERDEAALAAESAIFFDDPSLGRAELVSLRAAPVSAEMTELPLEELVVADEAGPALLAYIGARALEVLASGRPLSDGVAPHLLRLFSDPATPVGRRLAWRVVEGVCRNADDRLGLTRAKEHVLGGLNSRGLSESHDLPRFARFTLALQAGDDTGRDRVEQLDALEKMWERRSADLKDFDAFSHFQRLIFATGFARLGAMTRAHDLVEVVRGEAPAHDKPNAALFRLYLARIGMGHGDDLEAWLTERERVIGEIQTDKVRRPVLWFCKRSQWLRGKERKDRPPWLRPALVRLLEEAEADATLLAPHVARAMETREFYDYELVSAIEQCLGHARASGSEPLIREVLDAVIPRLNRIGILGHRARAVGACVEASATLEDQGGVRGLLDTILDIAHAPNTPSVRELLRAVRPALLALRRLGAARTGEEFLRELEPVAQRAETESVPLYAALAEGQLQLGHIDRADELLQDAISRCIDERLDYVARDEGGGAILDAVRHWPLRPRTNHCNKLLANVHMFNDTFTVKVYFPTFKLLLMERVVDAIADRATYTHDRLRTFLDTEELAIRRKILSDWSELCS